MSAAKFKPGERLGGRRNAPDQDGSVTKAAFRSVSCGQEQASSSVISALLSLPSVIGHVVDIMLCGIAQPRHFIII